MTERIIGSGDHVDLMRFEARVELAELTDCWNWTGSTNRGASDRPGYPVLSISGRKRVYAHRWSYEQFRGPIPQGLQIDHLCRNTICVNPNHLEPVTARENVRRGTSPCADKARQTECKYGHPFDEENTYPHPSGRDCRACRRRRDAERRPRKRAKA